MAKQRGIRYFSADSFDLQEALASLGQVFINDSIGIVVNGSPKSVPFLKEGQIYHIVEPRLLLILDGHAEVNLNMERYLINKGSVVMTTADVIMETEMWSDDMRLVGFLIKEDMHIGENMVVQLQPKEFDCLLRMAFLLWDIANRQPFHRETVRHLLMTIVSEIKYIKEEQESSDVKDLPSRQQQLFHEFKTLVNKHCECERKIPFYASHLRITPHHLSAVIKEASGQSVMYWINRAVLLRAKVLLKTSGMMSYEVAERLNFVSSSAFSNFFKRETGMTPREFQKA